VPRVLLTGAQLDFLSLFFYCSWYGGRRRTVPAASAEWLARSGGAGDTAEASEGKYEGRRRRRGRGGSIRGPPAAMGQRLHGVKARLSKSMPAAFSLLFSAGASFCGCHCSSLVLVTGTRLPFFFLLPLNLSGLLVLSTRKKRRFLMSEVALNFKELDLTRSLFVSVIVLRSYPGREILPNKGTITFFVPKNRSDTDRCQIE
jgi:hypothetical protein